LTLEQKAENGQVQRWLVEGPNLNRLQRMGVDKDFLKAGDVIEVCGFPFRQEFSRPSSSDAGAPPRPAMHAHMVVMPDGHMRLFGPYGKLENCIRPHDTTQSWVDFLNADPLGRHAWRAGQDLRRRGGAAVQPRRCIALHPSGGYTHYVATPTVFQGAPFSGLSPNGEAAYVPKFNAAFTAQYTVNLPNGATVTPRWDSYVQTEICSGQFQTSCTGSYTLSNLRLEYASMGREWTVAAGLENVTGKVYYYNIFDLNPFGEPTIEGQVAPPRTWFLQVSRKFGAK
jgi:hypothetical protein